MPETTPDTSLTAYANTDDAPLRKQVAQALATRPMTTRELADALPERTLNAIRPRINELLRMGCLTRDGKRENPSGNAAYVNHLTPLGKRYLRGEADPEPDPPLAAIRRNVVDAARDYCAGDIDADTLAAVVRYHDGVAERLDPEGER